MVLEVDKQSLCPCGSESTFNNLFYQVKLANTTEELNRHLKEDNIESILQAQGHTLQASNIEEKQKFVQAIAKYVLVDHTRCLLEELLDGLKVMGVLAAIQRHPERFREVFCKRNTELDAVMFDLIFEIHLAEEGTNIRSIQEKAVVFWRDFLQDCYGEFTDRMYASNCFLQKHITYALIAFNRLP